MKFKYLFLILALSLLLRTYQLAHNPPGFYSDEASWAYNAYSILLTNRDEYGRFLPWTFEAFGDYKLGVTVYSIIPFYILFGVNEFSARLPTAVYGTLAVLALYFLCQEMLAQKTSNSISKYRYLPHLSAAILAITPGHIFMSRGIWDVQAALFFTLIGVLCYLKAIRFIQSSNIPKIAAIFFLFLISSLSFVLSMYSYNSARVITPLLVIFITLHYRKTILGYLKHDHSPFHHLSIAIPLLIGLVLLSPQLLSLTDPQVTQRAQYVSIFQHGQIESSLYGAIAQDPQDQNVIFTRLLHNKVNFYATTILQNYLSHFDLNFLFLLGDTFEIFAVSNVGMLLFVSLPFVLAGLYFTLRHRPEYSWLLWIWIFCAPIPSALTIFTPSVSRAQNLVVPFAILTALGILHLTPHIQRQRQVFITVVFAAFTLNTGYWFNQYFHINPPLVAGKWNSGWSELANYLQQPKANNTSMVISNSQAPSYIFLSWYWRIPPQSLWQTRITNFQPDSNGLNTTTQILDLVSFSKEIDSLCSNQSSLPLCVGFFGELHPPQQVINNQYQQPAFSIQSTTLHMPEPIY